MAQDVRLKDIDIEEDNNSWKDYYVGSGDEASEKPNIVYESTVDEALKALETSYNNVGEHSLSTSGISSTEQVDKPLDTNDEPLDVEDDGDSDFNRFSSWLPLEFYTEKESVLPREVDIDKEDEDELWFVFDQKEDKVTPEKNFKINKKKTPSKPTVKTTKSWEIRRQNNIKVSNNIKIFRIFPSFYHIILV